MKRKIDYMECQWHKCYKHNEWLKLNRDCDACQDRFRCMTKKASRFRAQLDITLEGDYEMFAESRQEMIEEVKAIGRKLLKTAPKEFIAGLGKHKRGIKPIFEWDIKESRPRRVASK